MRNAIHDHSDSEVGVWAQRNAKSDRRLFGVQRSELGHRRRKGKRFANANGESKGLMRLSLESRSDGADQAKDEILRWKVEVEVEQSVEGIEPFGSRKGRSDGSDHSKRKIRRWLYSCVTQDFQSKIRLSVKTEKHAVFHEMACVEEACKESVQKNREKAGMQKAESRKKNKLKETAVGVEKRQEDLCM